METVIKTGRQIVQKQQTENPKELDERLTALKLQYNELGAKVSSVILIQNSVLLLNCKVKNNLGVVSKQGLVLVPFKAHFLNSGTEIMEAKAIIRMAI